MAYGNGKFVCIDNNAPNANIFTSPDAITWTQGVTIANSLTKITFGFGLFVAVGSNGPNGVACTSADAVNWSCVTTGAQQLNMVAFGYVYNGIGNDI